jgi:hypothetical protein
MFKEAGAFLWSKTPWFIRAFVMVVVLPNALAAGIAFFVWFVPWHERTLHATIRPYIEKQDAQIQHIYEAQSIQNKSVQDSLKRIEQHQSLLLAEMLRRSNP